MLNFLTLSHNHPGALHWRLYAHQRPTIPGCEETERRCELFVEFVQSFGIFSLALAIPARPCPIICFCYMADNKCNDDDEDNEDDADDGDDDDDEDDDNLIGLEACGPRDCCV